MSVVNVIPKGRENAISRSELSIMCGIGDRDMRREIAQAREQGVMIVNTGDGYYVTDDPNDVARQYRADRRRALSTLRRLRAMRKMLQDCGKLDRGRM